MFGQKFCRSGQVSGENGLVGEIDVGHVFVEFGPLLAFQSAPSLPLRIMAKHFFVLSALFRKALGARGAPCLPNTDRGASNDSNDNGGSSSKSGAMPPQCFVEPIRRALRPS